MSFATINTGSVPQSLSAFQETIWVGLDVHKETIALAAMTGAQSWLLERTYQTADLTKLRKALKDLSKKGELQLCYEASGCGFRLHRTLTEWGYASQVIAPSLIPSRPGQRKKCDRLDAQRLAEYLKAGLLTPVNVPTPEQEADRDLLRFRFAVRKDIRVAKHRVLKFLNRKSRLFLQTNWTGIHRAWLEKQEFELPSERLTYQHLLSSLRLLESRLQEVDKEVKALSETAPYREQVDVLRGFRGVDTLTAMVFLVELGDLRRFSSPRKLMAYLGLVPAVSQSGESGNKARGITKAGNTYVRHVLIQAAWNYQGKVVVGKLLRERQKTLPPWVIDASWKAHKRLNSRLNHLTEKRGRIIAIPAVARELACFLGHALLVQQGHVPA